MKFDGVNDYVNILSTGYFNYSSASFWFKTGANSRMAILGGVLGNSMIYFSDPVGSIGFGNAAGIAKDGGSGLYDNSWHHVVVNTLDHAGPSEIYVDGVNKTLSVGGDWRTDNRVTIGVNILTLTNTLYFNGSLDEVMVFNRTLSSSEVLALYDSRANKFNATLAGLADGQHNYTLYGVDEAGNMNNSGQRNFIVDATPPTITLPVYTNATSKKNTEILTLNISLSDATSGLTGSVCLVDVNGTNQTLALSGGWCNSTSVNLTNLGDGNQTIKVYANDSVDNFGLNDSYVVWIDTTPPEVTIVSPTVSQTFSSSAVSFEANTNENSTCNYSVDAGAANSSMTANAADTGFTASATLSNAAYTANFYCADVLGNLNSTESVTFTVSVSSPTIQTPSGGSGGGAGIISPKFTITPSSYEGILSLERTEFDVIEIENQENTAKTFTIEVLGLEGIISFENMQITIPAGKSAKVEFRLIPPKEIGIYIGKIIIKSGGTRKEVPVSIDVNSEKSLFDTKVFIPKHMKTINPGKNLVAQIELSQEGLKEKMDVTLNYIIKDFNENVYLTESETIAVYNQKSFDKEFHTEELPPGDYVLGIELNYPNGVAVASSQFKIKEKVEVNSGRLIVTVIILSLVFVFAAIIFMIKRYKKLTKQIKGK